MKKHQALVFIILIFTTISISGQNNKTHFGLKAGVNYGKYTPNKNSIDYNYKLGFYVGGFYIFEMEERWKFQPEILFSLQGSKINVNNIVIKDTNGNPLPNASPFDFEYEINELTISVPLMIKLYFSNHFYLESGPQFGFIIDRKINSSQQLLSGTDDSFIIQNGDRFDFGVSLGIGYIISEKIGINLRAFSGSIKRDDAIKSFVFNVGIEYHL